MAATPPALTMPAAPGGIETQPTPPMKPPGTNGAGPTPEAGAAAQNIHQQIETGVPAREVLAANTPPAAPEQQRPASSPANEGNLASPEVTAPNPPAEASPATPPPLPVENPQHTEGMNHLLRDGARYFLGRKDPRMIAIATALSASPQTPMGAEIRRNALLILRDVRPLAQRTGQFVQEGETGSTTAMVAFLRSEQPNVPDLLTDDLIGKVRTGAIEPFQLTAHLAQEQKPQMREFAKRFHAAVTGTPDARLPSYNGAELLHAAGISSWAPWNRNKMEQILRPGHTTLAHEVQKYAPFAFLFFMTFTSFFQPEQQAGHH